MWQISVNGLVRPILIDFIASSSLTQFKWLNSDKDIAIITTNDKSLVAVKLPNLWLDETKVSPYIYKPQDPYKFEPPSLTFATFVTENDGGNAPSLYTETSMR